MDRRTALKAAALVTGAGLSFNSGGRTSTEGGPDLFVRDWGSGPPILFVHGWGLGSEFWQYQMVRLAERGFRCVSYDRRGHGRSGDPGEGYEYDTLAGDLNGIIERLGLRNVTLVGHSMGAGEVVRYLTRHGSRRVARLVLVGATLPFLLKTADHAEGVDRVYFDGWRKQLTADFPKWALDNEGPFWAADTSQAMKEWARSLGLRCSLQALVACTHTLTETDFRRELGAIRVPALLVHGTEDRSVPVAFARRAAALIPGARLVEYPGAPHGLPITHGERFGEEVERFARG